MHPVWLRGVARKRRNWRLDWRHPWWCRTSGCGTRRSDEAIRAAFAGAPRALRHLLITRGRRRRARVEKSLHVVTLDGRRVVAPPCLLLRGGCDRGRQGISRSLQAPRAPRSAWRRSPSPHPPERAQAAQTGRLILVAEGNETNHQVIARQLELLGFAADIVGDGGEAFARWQGGSTRCFSPPAHARDGRLRAGAVIRRGERDRPRIPIIALTASAMREEAEPCRLAGMDEYLSKPVPLSSLSRPPWSSGFPPRGDTHPARSAWRLQPTAG